MLIPKGLAQEGTEGNVRSLEKQKKLAEDKRASELAEARKQAEKISSLTVEIVTKSGEGGRLFGSITSKDIADALKEQHQINIDKKKFQMDGPIKQTGESKVDIKLYPEVSASLTVRVRV
jgi:large subunit ribosomal protein L9